MALHAYRYTHCDTTSSFKGIGKMKPLKTRSQNPIYYPIFASIGDSWNVSDELMNKIEEFTCLMYSSPQYKTVDEVRYAMLIRWCGSGEQLSHTIWLPYPTTLTKMSWTTHQTSKLSSCHMEEVKWTSSTYTSSSWWSWMDERGRWNDGAIVDQRQYLANGTYWYHRENHGRW